MLKPEIYVFDGDLVSDVDGKIVEESVLPTFNTPYRRVRIPSAPLSDERITSTAGFRTLQQILAEQMVAGETLQQIRENLYDQDADAYVEAEMGRFERDPDIDVVTVERHRASLRQQFVDMRSRAEEARMASLEPSPEPSPEPAPEPSPEV